MSFVKRVNTDTQGAWGCSFLFLPELTHNDDWLVYRGLRRHDIRFFVYELLLLVPGWVVIEVHSDFELLSSVRFPSREG